MNLDHYDISVGSLEGKRVIWIGFAYAKDLHKEMKRIKAKWNPDRKMWYVPYNQHFRAMMGLGEDFGSASFTQLSKAHQAQWQAMKDQLELKGYAPATLRTYLSEFSHYLADLKNHQAESITPERLRSYFLYCIREKGFSESQMHSRLNALKFYYEQVLKQERFTMDVPRPKAASTLPKVLSQKEIARMFDVSTNIKHRLMLKLAYGMGLRVSEIVALKLSAISTSRMQVLIASSKGKKDRYVPLPESILPDLKAYYHPFKPKDYLFEGQYGGQYSTRSVQAVFKDAMQKAGIKRKIGIHGLRHSYATHLLEYGVDTAFIQKLLGHKDISTTLLYTKVSQAKVHAIKSPLDHLPNGES